MVSGKKLKNKNSKCKVVLMNPPTAPPSDEILLNLAYLSSALKKAGHETLVLDATAPHNRLTEEDIKKQILEFKPHFIGVTLIVRYIPQTYDFVKGLLELNIPIVGGGPHANCKPEEVLENGFDIVAIGEGEDTIIELAEYYLGNKKLKEIDGICFKDKKNKAHYTKPRQLIKDLDRITFPDYEAFPIKYYSGSDDPESNPIFWSVFSSRGCPFNCIFCASHNVFGRTFRSRSPQNVYDEIKSLVETYGAKTFAFQDDEAFINKKRVIEFCNLVKKDYPSLKFSGRLRIDSLDKDMLNAMSSAGFKRLAFGIESFNNESLLKMNKKYRLKDIEKGFKILEKSHFKAIYFNILIGFPWETTEHLKGILKEMSKIPESVIFFSSTCTLIPFPCTELYDRYHKEYGFTDWWLDPKENSPQKTIGSQNTFFMMFMFDQIPLYSDDTFWNHSPEMKKAIIDFCWKSSSISLKRILSPSEYRFVHRFSRMSHWVWKRSPKLERVLFYPYKKLAKWLKLDQKVNFINW